jgi:hypothetical protein
MNSELTSGVGLTTRPLRGRENAQIGGARSRAQRFALRSLAQALWLILVALSIGVFVVSIPARALQLLQIGYETTGSLQALGLPVEFIGYYIGTLDAIVFLIYLTVGMLVFWRKPDEWIALFTSVLLVTAATSAVRPADSLRLLDAGYHIGVLILFVISMGAAVLFTFTFPDGHFVPRLSAVVALPAVAYIAVLYGVPILVERPISWPPPPVPVVAVLAIAAGAVSQVYRYYRVSNASQREQTKWVIRGLGLAAFTMVSFLVVLPLLAPQVHEPGGARLVYVLLGVPFFFAGLIAFPLTLGWSIVRFHLWNIDLIVSRTVVYFLLSGIMAALFAGLELAGKEFFLALTGRESGLSAVMATLVVALAFTPVKQAIESVVNKRIKQVPDPDGRLLAVVDQIEDRVAHIHPQQATQRLLDEAVESFEAQGGRAILHGEGPLDVIFVSGELDSPADLVVPLRAGRNVLGEIQLGPRRAMRPYEPDDVALLERVCVTLAHAIELDRLTG